jgi:ribose-phosphate pyrophosphokinase
MPHRPLDLHGSRGLAEIVAKRLEVALAPHEERDFEDGEHKSRPLQDVRGRDVFVLHSLYGDDKESGNDKLCWLLFFCGAAKDARAGDDRRAISLLCTQRSPNQAARPDLPHGTLRRGSKPRASIVS